MIIGVLINVRATIVLRKRCRPIEDRIDAANAVTIPKDNNAGGIAGFDNAVDRTFEACDPPLDMKSDTSRPRVMIDLDAVYSSDTEIENAARADKDTDN